MKKNSLKVALNVSKTSVPNKINRARLIADAINNNPSVFTSPIPTVLALTNATNDLEIAWNNAADGGKSKTAIMHDKESELMKLLNDMAHYVEGVADGDEGKVHLAAMDVKKKANIKNLAEFEVFQTDDRGAVGVKVKAKTKTIYKWQYCKSPTSSNVWTTASTSDISHATIGDLEVGAYYYFRVIFVKAGGEFPSIEIGFAVN